MRTTPFLYNPAHGLADDWSDDPDCSLHRLCHSDTALRLGIDNHPGPAEQANLLRLRAVLAEVRQLLGYPLEITSAYRCRQLNEAVGGVPDSQHIQGQAADFRCAGFGDAITVATAIAKSNVCFDQLILEFGRWIHLSVPDSGSEPRREVLTIRSSAQGYLEGLIDENGEQFV